MKASLAETATPRHASGLIKNPAWACEPKYDGIRTLVHCGEGRISWYNRNGEPLTKPTPAESVLAYLPFRAILDGEIVGNHLHVFDAPHFGQDISNRPFSLRRQLLEGFELAKHCGSNITLTPIARTWNEKTTMVVAANDAGWEGVIFKDIHASYLPGRGLAMQKLKFTHTIDVVIGQVGVDGKDAASLWILDGDYVWREVGKCSLVGKPPVTIGDVVEVRYLYVGAGNRLVQPRMVRKRDDKTVVECTIDQIDHTERRQPT